ncbi:hypothetical protein DL96DRAFT_1599850 [Flagelloscypha sp. PMI_526]|nr:hypothetical protein DL96DRAFT_1599850 [Flagelloscypha sp. PMI_526]
MDEFCDYCRTRPKHNNGTYIYQYCRAKCTKKATKRYDKCLQCLTLSPKLSSLFCGRRCTNFAERARLLSVPRYHRVFKDVANQFDSTWSHFNKPHPTVRRMFKIVNARESDAYYESYAMQVGNERRRFHGTTRACQVGEHDAATRLCRSSLCSLCGILRSSFNIDLFGANRGAGRFGRGIYSTSVSSKADDYSRNCLPSCRTKAVILANVAIGNGLKLIHDMPFLLGPPRGYNSILGEPAFGGSLNHDEVVVYNNDAIRPSFLIMYS